jgi:phosphoglucomutase
MSPPASTYDENHSTSPGVLRVSEQLIERGETGRLAAARLSEWASGRVPLVNTAALAQFTAAADAAAIYDEFWRLLPFGTGGRRGHVGFGSNRLNPTTVALTVQGHCEYMRRNSSSSNIVAIANDVRVFNDLTGRYAAVAPNPLLGVSSYTLARLAASIYAANGVTVYMAGVRDDSEHLTTPQLSHAIRTLEADGGVVISASHNHPDDNGIKVYNRSGAQPIAPQDQELTDVIEAITQIQQIDIDEAIESGLVRDINEAIGSTYVDMYVDLLHDVPIDSGTRVVYTPLCGSGGLTVGLVLERLGCTVLQPPEEGPDGTFAAIPFRSPNPEIPDATAHAMRFATSQDVGIVLASDPDADRLGADILDSSGAWSHLTGNQIATILCYYLLVDDLGPRRKGLVITTTVTTRALRRIVELSPGSIFIGDLPVGFKYVGAVLSDLERTGEYRGTQADSSTLVLAAEESYGFLATSKLRDKDATSAAVYLSALHGRLLKEGRTIVEYYQAVLGHIGAFAENNRSIILLGEAGARDIATLMASLRTDPPTSFGDSVVTATTDYWDPDAFGPIISETDRLSRNVVSFETPDFTVTVRPSNTEPKLKFYVQAEPAQKHRHLEGSALVLAASKHAAALAEDIYGALLTRLGLNLGHAALALPDVLALPQKLAFEHTIVPELKERLQNDAADPGAIGRWLEQACGDMTPGASPLPALRLPLTRLLDEWRDSLGEKVYAVFQAWVDEI